MKKLMAIVVATSIVILCVACAPHESNSDPINSLGNSMVKAGVVGSGENSISNSGPINSGISFGPVNLVGEWIVDLDGDVMLNPQTSGLKFYAGALYSLSDASAHESQILKLHQISMSDSHVVKKFGPTEFSDAVKNSCFYSYLSKEPDYEALVPIPDEPEAWIFVTEDASRSEPLSDACQQQYAQSGSTFYPTLVVRLQLNGERLQVTHVRAIQFPIAAQVGDFPNDGIEGLSITRDNRLLLGLEKDANKQPRVFELKLTQDFWQTPGFATVQDSELLLPTFEQGNHPINGMDVYYPNASSEGYLLAAARNDNELWVVDLAKIKPTKRIKLAFYAPSDITQNTPEIQCEPTHLMNNASIEGLAVVNDEIWMVNDPWKANYHKNIVCAADQHKYHNMAPLLFNMHIDADWFN